MCPGPRFTLLNFGACDVASGPGDRAADLLVGDYPLSCLVISVFYLIGIILFFAVRLVLLPFCFLGDFLYPVRIQFPLTSFHGLVFQVFRLHATVLTCTNAIPLYIDTQRALGPCRFARELSFRAPCSIPPWIVKSSLIPLVLRCDYSLSLPCAGDTTGARCPAFSRSTPTQLGSNRNLCFAQICGKNCLWLLATLPDFPLQYNNYCCLGSVGSVRHQKIDRQQIFETAVPSHASHPWVMV